MERKRGCGGRRRTRIAFGPCRRAEIQSPRVGAPFQVFGIHPDQDSRYDLPSSGLNTLLIFQHSPCTRN